MVNKKAKTAAEYLQALPSARRATLGAVRKVILRNLPAGYKEGMYYGMIGYYIPLSKFPNTYNGYPIGPAGLANQKQYMALYLMAVYGDKDINQWFRGEWKKTGKKLDMGRSCLRFRKLEDLDLDLIGRLIAKVTVNKYIAIYNKSRHARKK